MLRWDFLSKNNITLYYRKNHFSTMSQKRKSNEVETSDINKRTKNISYTSTKDLTNNVRVGDKTL